MALQLRSHCRKTLQNPCIYRFFSSSSDGGEDDKPPSSPSSSFLSSIKASLRQSSPSPPRSRNPNSPPPSPPPRPSRIESLDEIRKNLSEFHRRSAPPSREGHDASSPTSISFQDLYKRNVIGQGNADASTDTMLSLASIRERLRQLRPSSPAAGIDRRRGQDDSPPSSISLSALKESLKLKPSDVSGSSSDPLRTSLFGREAGEAKTEADSQASMSEFVKTYSYGELGEKLKKLRPPEAESKKKKDWFSIVELNERLKKLREIEEKETDSRNRWFDFKELRDGLIKLKNVDDAKARKQSMERLAFLGQLGGQVTPSFMLSPPKDQLVERYFHPDNMSSAEKLKLELKRVREEFKMSESDCGSSRVQVALLTTKIKHLSSVLHKKDKHSRKGLQAMVQRRKKLLKYLRRTDWDSYCFVLSKLGLRDNPGLKS